MVVSTIFMRINGDDLKLLLVMLFFSLFFLYDAAAKPHMIAEVGKISCLDKTKQANALLKSLGVKVSTTKRSEKKLVANVGETLSKLTNEAQARRLMKGLSVYFKKTLGNSSFGGCLPAHQLIPSQIHMGRTCPNGYKIPHVEGIFVHELGHFVANKLGLYPRYKREVTKRCKLSKYMYQNSAGRKHKTINEEFAEVFAAYLIYGKKLKRKCPKSYDFMKKHLYLGSDSECK